MCLHLCVLEPAQKVQRQKKNNKKHDFWKHTHKTLPCKDTILTL